MASTAPLRSFPAYRINRGDTIRHNNRKAVVVHVEHVVFYSRNRNVVLDPADRNGVTLRLRYTAGGHAELTVRNYDLVRTYR